MGRELKRVAMDFDWPRGKTWKGFLNPYYAQRIKCLACKESGYSPAAKVFADQWYGTGGFDPVAYGVTPLTVDHPAILALAQRNVAQSPSYYGSGGPAVQRECYRLFDLWKGQWSHQLSVEDVAALVTAGRLMDFTHVPVNDEQAEVVRQKLAAGGNSWLPYPNGRIPTADEVNTWSMSGMGHDGINRSVCVEARCLREGVPYLCGSCAGSGYTWPAGVEALYDAWVPVDPPVGEGYQLWETTSEGSPLSPVFASLEELCNWCEGNATTFGSFRATAAEWLVMLGGGFVSHVEGNMVFR